ncbi:hypothetical protein IOD13_14665 [Brevibacterium casei]|nr:hypothetical protein [Brevibacterium casei]
MLGLVTGLHSGLWVAAAASAAAPAVPPVAFSLIPFPPRRSPPVRRSLVARCLLAVARHLATAVPQQPVHP